MKALRLFWSLAREVAEMLYQFEQPFANPDCRQAEREMELIAVAQQLDQVIGTIQVLTFDRSS